MSVFDELGDTAAVETTFNTMRDLHLSLSQESMDLYVSSSVFAGKPEQAAEAFLAGDVNRGVSLSKGTQELLLESLNFQGRHEHAVQVFERLESLGESPFSTFVQGQMVVAFKMLGEDQIALRRMAQLTENAKRVSTRPLNAVLRAQAAVAPDLVKDLFDVMIRRRCEPDETSFCILFESLASRTSGEEDIKAALSQMQATGIVAGEKTAEALASTFIDMGQVNRGLLVLEDATRRGLKPQLHSYEGVVRYFAGRSIIEMMEFLRSLIRKNVKMSAGVYNIAIQALIKRDHLPAAHELYAEMKRSGKRPLQVTVVQMLDACAQEGHVERCMFYFDEMFEHEFRPDKASYNTVLRLLAQGLHLDVLLKLYRAMQMSDVRPDRSSDQAILRGFCESADFARGVTYFRKHRQEMSASEVRSEALADSPNAESSLQEQQGQSARSDEEMLSSRRVRAIASLLTGASDSVKNQLGSEDKAHRSRNVGKQADKCDVSQMSYAFSGRGHPSLGAISPEVWANVRLQPGQGLVLGERPVLKRTGDRR